MPDTPVLTRIDLRGFPIRKPRAMNAAPWCGACRIFLHFAFHNDFQISLRSGNSLIYMVFDNPLETWCGICLILCKEWLGFEKFRVEQRLSTSSARA
jgi:hypothetical protein